MVTNRYPERMMLLNSAYLWQRSQTCGPRGYFARPAIFFGNFEIIDKVGQLVYSSAFKSARSPSQQVQLKQT